MANNDPSTRTYDFCRQRKWNKVEQACKTDPIDATFKSADDRYPLHVACRNQPSVRAVRALLAAFPKATSLPNAKGELPLHEACRFNASIAVIRELVQQNPGAVLVSPSPVAVLYSARESTETNMEKTNSAVLWHTNKADLLPVSYASIFWQKTRVLLEAIATLRPGRRNANNDEPLILHAAVCLESCPIEVLLYCFDQYPHQVSIRDESGRFPLHIAVVAPFQCAVEPLLRSQQLRERSVLVRLVEAYPQAVKFVDPNEPSGRFPLHTALSNGHSWNGGIKDLVHHFPGCLALRDPATGLYPFQMATHDHTTVFQLIRSMPSELANARSAPVVFTAPTLQPASKSNVEVPLAALQTRRPQVEPEPAIISEESIDRLSLDTTMMAQDVLDVDCNLEARCRSPATAESPESVLHWDALNDASQTGASAESTATQTCAISTPQPFATMPKPKVVVSLKEVLPPAGPEGEAAQSDTHEEAPPEIAIAQVVSTSDITVAANDRAIADVSHLQQEASPKTAPGKANVHQNENTIPSVQAPIQPLTVETMTPQHETPVPAGKTINPLPHETHNVEPKHEIIGDESEQISSDIDVAHEEPLTISGLASHEQTTTGVESIESTLQHPPLHDGGTTSHSTEPTPPSRRTFFRTKQTAAYNKYKFLISAVCCYSRKKPNANISEDSKERQHPWRRDFNHVR